MAGKVFDLHIEIGINSPPVSDFYAKIVLGQNAVIFEQDGSTPASAISKLVMDLESSGMWPAIAKGAGNYRPAGAPTTKSATPPVPKAKVDPKISRKKPMELTQVSHPDCTSLCTSFEFFGKKKCAGMCQQRHGV